MNVASEAPFSCGVSVVRVTSPAALGDTRMSTGNVVDAPEVVPRTTMRWRPLGGVGRDRHVERDLGRRRAVRFDAVDREAAAAQDGRPARRDVADRQRDATGRVVVTEISKLGAEPGATAIAGKGSCSR